MSSSSSQHVIIPFISAGQTVHADSFTVNPQSVFREGNDKLHFEGTLNSMTISNKKAFLQGVSGTYKKNGIISARPPCQNAETKLKYQTNQLEALDIPASPKLQAILDRYLQNAPEIALNTPERGFDENGMRILHLEILGPVVTCTRYPENRGFPFF